MTGAQTHVAREEFNTTLTPAEQEAVSRKAKSMTDFVLPVLDEMGIAVNQEQLLGAMRGRILDELQKEQTQGGVRRRQTLLDRFGNNSNTALVR